MKTLVIKSLNMYVNIYLCVYVHVKTLVIKTLNIYNITYISHK